MEIDVPETMDEVKKKKLPVARQTVKQLPKLM